MTDREKAVTGLKCLMTEDVQCDECPYVRSDYCIESIARDAFALLREQEPAEPHQECDRDEGTWYYGCGSCHQAIDYRDAYCRHCGRRVKWE